jgi:penicillin-binding protein 2
MFFQDYFNRRRVNRGFELEEINPGVVQNGEEEMALGEPISNRGLKIFRIIIAIIFSLLALRVFYLEIIKGDYYLSLAKENRVRFIAIKAPRGLIFDRNGKELVQNSPSFDVILVPADLPKNIEERRQEVTSLALVLNINDQSLAALVESQDFESLNPILIKENISEDESLVFSENKSKLLGFQLDKTAVRNYVDGNYFSAAMGYTGKINKEDLQSNSDYLMTDYIGKVGIEASYEKYLRGVNGKQKVEVDSAGNVKQELGSDQPVNGSDLTVSIDADLQKKIQDELQSKLDETKTKTASAVAIDPRNGEVLAMVNLPSYDNNLFAKGISAGDYSSLMNDPEKPMFNRAISGEYPPGSTFKPLVASAALQEGIITSSTTLNCPAEINIGSYRFPDWKPHGVTDVRKAIAESVDIFFYAVGGGWENITGIGIDKIQQYANRFGLGKTLGIDIPGESKGLIPNREWKLSKMGERWFLGDDYHCAIGQGFITATPLQLANYIAAIANGGTVYKPHIVTQIKKIDGSIEKIGTTILDKNIISASNIAIVREGMWQTVTSGTAQPLKDLPVAVAGKTGTAQFGSENKEHGWFVSFAPYDNPTIAMVVLVEGGGEGFSTAEPVTKDVYQWYFGDRNK